MLHKGKADLVYVPRIQGHTSHNRREPLPNLAKVCMRSKRRATVRREETIPAAKIRLAFVEQLDVGENSDSKISIVAGQYPESSF